MLNAVIKFTLKNRLFVTVAAALVFFYGVRVILKLPVDVFPDLNRPTVNILIEAGGLAPEEVETLVIRPVEVTMNGAPGVVRVRSVAGIGLAILYVEFEWGTDIYIDRQLVTERLNLARESLPAGVEPFMGPISSIMGEIMLVGMHSKTGQTSPMEVRTLADWVVRQRLLTLGGVSQVISIGGGRKQVQVLVDPLKLSSFGLSLHEVENAVSESQTNTTGGFIENQNQEFLVRNIGRTSKIDEIADTVVAYKHNIPIRVKEIAAVQTGAQVKRGDASVNAEPAVILSIQKQPGVDTVPLTRDIEKALKEIKRSLPEDVEFTELFKQSNFIESAIENVEEALRDGAILVAIILFLFLANFQTTLITLTAIPLSFVCTAIFFKLFGLSINTMTLGGLAIAIGELVDDAIVGVENVLRRLKENRHKEKPDHPIVVIYRASAEIRNSIVYATVIVILVFLPMFFLTGIEGRLIAPIGFSYVTSILFSLLVSLTVTPALCYYLLPKARVLEKEEYGSRFVLWLKRMDEKYLLGPALKHPNIVMGIAAALIAVAIASVPFMGREFLPEFNEGTATINMLSVPGTSLAESNRVGTLAEKLMLSVPEVISTGRRTGRAELDEHAEGVHYTEIDVDFKKSNRTREEILGAIRNKLSEIPGITVNIGQPISHRLDHMLSGVRAQIAIKIFGEDLNVLRQKAREVEAVAGTIPGVVDLQVEKQVLIPQVRIRIKREEAKKYGIRVGDLAETLETAFNGKVVSQVLEGQRAFDLFVRFKEEDRGNIEALRNALIDTPSGFKLPLSQVADVLVSRGPNVILHENVQRRIIISCNASGRDLGSVVGEIQEKIKKQVNWPTGYFVRYEGQFQSQQEATRIIALLSLFAFGGIFLVLYTHFRSVAIVLQILINIPLSLIGSVAAIFLTGGVMSVASLVGFITLTGIASRNTIMMISHYIHLVKEEGEAFDEKMIIRGSLERLVPVLMTASVAGLALIPLVLAKGQPGKEILYPVATVILGGLMTSTFLDMAVTPAVFWKFGKKALEQYLKEGEEQLSFEERGTSPIAG